MFDEDDYVVERTLCQLPSCHVFKIPKLNSAVGYRAADWPKDPLWTGKLKIISRGREATIILWEEKNGEMAVFAKCPVKEGSVEKVTDSGRYFVLKITNANGQHAFIGMAFNERNDAFDFNVALQEHKSEVEREDQAAAGIEAPSAPSQDFSLKAGEKITVKIGNKSGSRREKAASGGGLLPPPGSGGKVGGLAPPQERHAAAPAAAPPPSADSSVFSFDSFGSADPFSSSAATKSAPPPSSDPFFGSSDPFSATPAVPSAATSSGSPQLDAFGFPIAPATSSSGASSSGSGNLLDF